LPGINTYQKIGGGVPWPSVEAAFRRAGLKVASTNAHVMRPAARSFVAGGRPAAPSHGGSCEDLQRVRFLSAGVQHLRVLALTPADCALTQKGGGGVAVEQEKRAAITRLFLPKRSRCIFFRVYCVDFGLLRSSYWWSRQGSKAGDTDSEERS
jgi:hypothetical protein